MKITFLGTGTSQGVPVIGCPCSVCTSLDFRDKRLRVSVMVEVDGKRLVIDSGPDFRQQMIRERVKDIDAVLLTHEHKDHVAGLDDVRAFNYLNNKSMPVFGLQRVLNRIRIEFAYAFEEKKYPGVPQIDLFEINEDSFEIGGIQIRPFLVFHAKLPVLGFRIGDFSYITDANSIPPTAREIVKGSKVLVLNALQKDYHISHFTLDEAIEVARELAIPQVYFTHISHKMGCHLPVSNELPEHIRLAYDGLQIPIPQ